MALTTAPFLVLLEPRLVPGPLLVCSLALTLLVAARERRTIDFRGVAWALAGRVPGTGLGALALVLVDPSSMALLLAAVVLVAVAMSASGFRIVPRRPVLVGAGVVSGFMGTTSSIGGPPIAMIYQHHPGPEMRGTLAGYFIAGASMSLVAIFGVGHFDLDQGRWALTIAPGALVGFLLSGRTARWLDGGYTRPAILVVSGVGAVAVIARQLL